ncbi:hypothetical protein DKN16_18370 [Salmonella enterica]|nr:hypothetical protein [Salmonella enterica]
MEEQANKILVELLQKAVGGIDAAVSFSQAQIPDIVHQLLVWNLVSSLLLQLLGVVMVAGAFFALSHAMRCRRRGDEWTRFMPGSSSTSIAYDLCFPAFIVSSAIGVVIAICSFDWLKIWLAPKLYLLEYAASLIK